MSVLKYQLGGGRVELIPVFAQRGGVLVVTGYRLNVVDLKPTDVVKLEELQELGEFFGRAARPS